MDGMTVRLLVTGILGAHGFGHVLGWMLAWGVARFEGVSSRSWALSPLMGDDAARIAAGLLFVVPTIGFLVAAGGLVTGQPWWRTVAVASAAVSIGCTVLFPQAFTASSTVGSLAVNAMVLVGLLATDWGQAPV